MSYFDDLEMRMFRRAANLPVTIYVRRRPVRVSAPEVFAKEYKEQTREPRTNEGSPIMDKTFLRKYLLNRIDVAQREIEINKDLLSSIDNEDTPTAAPAVNPVNPVQEEAPKAKAKTKAEPKKKAAPKVEEVVEAEAADESDIDFLSEEETEVELTIDDVRGVVKDFAAVHGKAKTMSMLQKKFNVTAINMLKPEQYEVIVALCKKHMVKA